MWEPLDSRTAIDLGPVLSLAALTEALRGIVAPDAVVRLEGGSVAWEVVSRLEPYLSSMQPGSSDGGGLTIMGGGPTVRRLIRLQRRSVVLEVMPTPQLWEEMLALVSAFPQPEVADHIVVHRGGRAMIEAHDLPDGSVLVANGLDPDFVDGLRAATQADE